MTHLNISINDREKYELLVSQLIEILIEKSKNFHLEQGHFSSRHSSIDKEQYYDRIEKRNPSTLIAQNY